MIHEVSGFAEVYGQDAVYVISSHGQWLPGVYATSRAARYAYQFHEADLVELRNATNGWLGENRPITTEDLRARARDVRKGVMPDKCTSPPHAWEKVVGSERPTKVKGRPGKVWEEKCWKCEQKRTIVKAD